MKLLRVSADQARVKLDQLLKEQDLASNSQVDVASHFILRLSYCQTEELRRWFLQQECALFQHRLHSLNDKQLAQSVKSYARLQPIKNKVKEDLKNELMAFMSPVEFLKSQFYAVPFQQVLDLVSTRQCYVTGGQAYVPQAKVYSILVAKFRTELSRCLALMAQAGTFKAGSTDPETVRVYPLLKTMNTCLVNSEPSGQDAGLSANQQLNAFNVDKLVGNMPLCMRQLHSGMVKDKKLRHWGRLQYGLFLKGAGLSMDDALAFFQRHFSQVTGEQFQKQYAYNVRHMYGREGKRATYTAYSCTKIIFGQAPSSVGDHHGCPYKHYDTDHLSNLLQRLKVGNASDRAAIIGLKKSNQYQLACQKHFEVMHPNALSMNEVSLDNVGNHPNAWFRASVAYSEAVHHKNGSSNNKIEAPTAATTVTAGGDGLSSSGAKAMQVES